MLSFCCLPCLFCFFCCYFQRLNLCAWDITWYPTNRTLWYVNQKPIRLRGRTVPDYIVMDDMLIFCCLPCIFCCFYCYFRWQNLYSRDITWCPRTRNLWSLNQFSLTTLFCCFYCYFCWLNLYSRDITSYPMTENFWSVNQKPTRLRRTTVPDYIVIDDMLIFCCLDCLYCCFYFHFLLMNLCSWDITWYPTTRKIWSVNWKPTSLRGTTLPDYIVIDDMLIFGCLPCLFCCFYCHFLWINLYSWDITWYPTTGNLWSVNQKPTRLRWTTVPDYIVIHDMLIFCCLPCLFCCFHCYFRWLNLYSWDITWYPTTRNLWSLNQFSQTILFCCFYCHFCGLNLYSRDITWYPMTENLWSVNQKPTRLRRTTVPDYIVIDDMLIFCCLDCLYCCFYFHFLLMNLYSWDITWYPATRKIWSVNWKPMSLRGTTLPDHIVIDAMLIFCYLPCLFCSFYCDFLSINLYSWDITWYPTTGNFWSLNQ